MDEVLGSPGAGGGEQVLMWTKWQLHCTMAVQLLPVSYQEHFSRC